MSAWDPNQPDWANQGGWPTPGGQQQPGAGCPTINQTFGQLPGSAGLVQRSSYLQQSSAYGQYPDGITGAGSRGVDPEGRYSGGGAPVSAHQQYGNAGRDAYAYPASGGDSIRGYPASSATYQQGIVARGFQPSPTYASHSAGPPEMAEALSANSSAVNRRRNSREFGKGWDDSPTLKYRRTSPSQYGATDADHNAAVTAFGAASPRQQAAIERNARGTSPQLSAGGRGSTRSPAGGTLSTSSTPALVGGPDYHQLLPSASIAAGSYGYHSRRGGDRKRSFSINGGHQRSQSASISVEGTRPSPSQYYQQPQGRGGERIDPHAEQHELRPDSTSQQQLQQQLPRGGSSLASSNQSSAMQCSNGGSSAGAGGPSQAAFGNPYHQYINSTRREEIPSRVFDLCRAAVSSQECVVGISDCIMRWQVACPPLEMLKAITQAYCQRTVGARGKLAIMYIFNEIVQRDPVHWAENSLRGFLQVIPPLVAGTPDDVQQAHCRVLDVLKDRGFFTKEQVIPIRKAFQKTPVDLAEYLVSSATGTKQRDDSPHAQSSTLAALVAIVSEETNPAVRGKISATLRALKAYAYEPRICDPAVNWAQNLVAGVGDLQQSDASARRSLSVGVTRALDFCSMEMEIMQNLLVDWTVAVEENRLRLLRLTSCLLKEASFPPKASHRNLLAGGGANSGATGGRRLSTPSAGGTVAPPFDSATMAALAERRQSLFRDTPGGAPPSIDSSVPTAPSLADCPVAAGSESPLLSGSPQLNPAGNPRRGRAGSSLSAGSLDLSGITGEPRISEDLPSPSGGMFFGDDNGISRGSPSLRPGSRRPDCTFDNGLRGTSVGQGSQLMSSPHDLGATPGSSTATVSTLHHHNAFPDFMGDDPLGDDGLGGGTTGLSALGRLQI